MQIGIVDFCVSGAAGILSRQSASSSRGQSKLYIQVASIAVPSSSQSANALVDPFIPQMSAIDVILSQCGPRSSRILRIIDKSEVARQSRDITRY